MWYAASILQRCENLTDPSRLLHWQESIVLFDASSEDELMTAAQQWGRRHEVEYEVENGERVRWVFAAVQNTCALDSDAFADGLEVFSRFLRRSEAESMLQPFGD